MENSGGWKIGEYMEGQMGDGIGLRKSINSMPSKLPSANNKPADTRRKME